MLTRSGKSGHDPRPPCLPRLVLEAAVVAALELVGEAVARDPPLRHRLVDAQRGRVGQPL